MEESIYQYELMGEIKDEEVMGMTDQKKPFTTEETLAARKVAESRHYTNRRHEVAVPWVNDEPPLYCSRKSAEHRFYTLEKHVTSIEHQKSL